MSSRRRWTACLLGLVLLAACRESPPPAAPGQVAPPVSASEVVALLDGEPILRGELGSRAAFRIYRHEVDIHALLVAEVERLVDERLLAREARRRDTTPRALLAEVEARVEPTTEAEVDRYLAEHPNEAAPDAERRARIHHYLDETRRIEQRLAFVEQLRKEAGYTLLLQPPQQPRTELPLDEAPARGPADAPVTVVHFASFASRPSAQSALRLARLREEIGGRLRVVHRNALRDRDEMGLLAARVGFLAQDEGDFWVYHDSLFARGGRIDRAAIAEAAGRAGLDPGALERAALDGRLLDRVRADLTRAREAGAPREPTLFVNGRYLSGLSPYEELRRLVFEELGEGP